MTKHSPGPWTAEPCQHILQILDVNKSEVAEVYIGPDYDRHAIGEGDARLIAAAPTLLEACKKALLLMKPIEAEAVTGHENICNAEEILMAAIKEATGEEP